MSKKTKQISLIDRCKLRMSVSKLRMIDEDLYTSDISNVSMDKDKFLEYHEAYSAACAKWPQKPIDYIVEYIRKKLAIKKPLSKQKFADLGCGKEPQLKLKLPRKAKVFSFDLISVHKDVKEANMAKIPLRNSLLNCVVYSLSLMAKNIGPAILEGKRILKVGGSMLIVEVTSRFEGKDKWFSTKLEKLGLRMKTKKSMEPNGYFTFFHFVKADAKLDYSPYNLNIELKPCAYKAR